MSLPNSLSLQGLASEAVDYVFMNRQWLHQIDAPGALMSWKGLNVSNVPLHQVLWKHEPLNVAFIATGTNLPALQAAMYHVHKSVQLNHIHVVLLCSASRDLHEGATFFEDKLRWAWIDIQKFSRPISGIGGVHYHAWFTK